MKATLPEPEIVTRKGKPVKTKNIAPGYDPITSGIGAAMIGWYV